MALQVGSRLGHYDVTAKIGEGGMGEVYRARDTKLDRDVALKVLPEAFTQDPDRLARFEREAKVLASLNHPNIGGIHGLEESDGVRALVLELVEGPTLADRIKKGPIPLDEALPIAKQIAEALEAAHEAGVIHRDLKPANIKVRDDGTVKVLDFGLAKALDPSPEADPSQSPTLTAAATQMGVIMGTAAYMSPEQAKGKVADKRADIWAFGIVLFEMLTGQRVFSGETVSETLADVMKSEPRWQTLSPDVPPKLSNLIRRCLEKDPRQRIRDVGDVRLAIAGAFETTVNVPSANPAAPQLTGWRRVSPWAAGIVVGSLITSLAFWLTRPEPVTARVERFAIPPPAPERVGVSEGRKDIAISADGTRVFYTATGGAPYDLYVRPVDSLASTPIQGLDAAPFELFVSPDGAWVGFFDVPELTLKRVSLRGGPPVRICNTGAPTLGVSWAEDDTIIFGNVTPSGLWRVSASGGEPEEVTTPDPEQGEVNHGWPHFLPGGRAVLFTIFTEEAIETAQIALLDLDSGEQRVLVSGGSAPLYSPSGHIVYGVRGTLWAVSFDLNRLEVTDPTPVPVLEGVVTKPSGAVNFDLSRDGSLVYITGATGGSGRSLVWVDREGREEALEAEQFRDYSTVRVSPDGARLALDFDEDVWTYDIARRTFDRVTTDPAHDQSPVWTRDGERLVFQSDRGGSPELFWTLADGSGTPERISTRPADLIAILPEAFTPDGRTLLFSEFHGAGTGSARNVNIGTVSMVGDLTAGSLIERDFGTFDPAVSPDGRWIAYVSNLSGGLDIYAERFPDLGNRQRISTSGGRVPRWSLDGTELFYQSIDGRQLFAVPIVADPTFAVGVPEVLFEGAYLRPVRYERPYDVTPSGDRFVMIKTDATIDADTTSQVILVQNWVEELKRLVPTN